MTRLIDADALIGFIVEEAQDLRTLSTKTVGQAISKTQTIDAVPVIRCKDCLWHYGTICRRNNTMFWNDDCFCSYAEREEDGTI